LELSVKAQSELKDALIKNIGIEIVSQLSKDEINHLGVFFLTVFAEALKLRCSKTRTDQIQL